MSATTCTAFVPVIFGFFFAPSFRLARFSLRIHRKTSTFIFIMLALHLHSGGALGREGKGLSGRFKMGWNGFALVLAWSRVGNG